MPMLSTAEESTFLACYFGANKAAGAPASFELALFNDDPALGGVEMDAAGGYVRKAVANDGTNFPAPADGQIVCAPQIFATPTGEWTAGGDPDTARWAVFYNPTTGNPIIGDALGVEVNVEQSGGVVTVQPVIYFGGQTLDDDGDAA